MIINIVKKDILDKIYYVDDNSIEYWRGIPIEFSVATMEEQEEMENLLKDFIEKEEDIK